MERTSSTFGLDSNLQALSLDTNRAKSSSTDAEVLGILTLTLVRKIAIVWNIFVKNEYSLFIQGTFYLKCFITISLHL